MIKIVATFPVTYVEVDGHEDYEIYEGLLNVSPEAADFYNRLFGMDVVSGESSPLGCDENWDAERVPASAIGLSKTEDRSQLVTGGFMIDNLDEAKKVLADQKISILTELKGELGPVLVIADPDKNLIALYE